MLRCTSPVLADCVAKVFFAFGRETLIQDRARTSNNDSKEPTLRFDCYKFLFHRACLATFATQSAQSGHTEAFRYLSASLIGRLGQALSGYPPLQCRCRSRARASLRTRHQGPSIMGIRRRGGTIFWAALPSV